jgi:hypothetical protein
MIKPFRFILLVLLGAVGLTAGFALFAACAHAKVVMTGAPEVRVVTGVDPDAVVAWIGAITGTGSLVLVIVFKILQVVAPRTPATWDDDLRDTIGVVLGMRDHVQEILTHARTAAAQAAPTTTVVVAQAPTEPSVHTASTSPGTISTIKETP